MTHEDESNKEVETSKEFIGPSPKKPTTRILLPCLERLFKDLAYMNHTRFLTSLGDDKEAISRKEDKGKKSQKGRTLFFLL